MRRSIHAFVLLVVIAAAPTASPAQVAEAPPAVLIADKVVATPDGVLTASGEIEVFYDGTRLTAQEISYTRETGRLTITGPIRITRPIACSSTLASATASSEPL